MAISKTLVECLYCKNKFYKENRYIKRGIKRGFSGHFCNRKCRSRHIMCIHPELKNNITLGSISDEFSPYRKYLSSIIKRYSDTDITLSYLKLLWDKQGGRCAISNLEMTIPPNTNRPVKHIIHRPFIASIDRIDSSKQYTKDNIQWVCLIANYAKNEFNESDVILFCKSVALYHN